VNNHIPENFKGKTIVVTGATGFVGNRLIEILHGVEGIKIRALVRNFGNAIRLARFPVEIIKGDILDKESCRKAFAGADYVFHCAYGNKGGEEARHQVNHRGTLNLLELSKENDVAALLFLSTISVYGSHRTGMIDETTPPGPSVDAYGKSKREAENLVIRFGEENKLPVVVLQPTGIYGPWAPSYGLKMLSMVSKGRVPLSLESDGIANLVYVDDVIQAMLKSILSSASYNKRYIISGPDPISWETFFNSFEPLTGRPTTIRLPESKIAELYKDASRKPSLLPIVRGLLKIDVTEAKKLLQFPLLKRGILQLIKILPAKFTQKLKRQNVTIRATSQSPGTDAILPLDPGAVAFYSSTAKACFKQAAGDFDYEPAFYFKDGFALQMQWHRWHAGLIES
jgi:nucleoside-diphosphate-sugar epimerase